MILRFELRRLFGLPLLSAEEGPGAPAPLENELLFDLTGENPENRLFGQYGPKEIWDRLGTAGLLAGPDPDGLGSGLRGRREGLLDLREVGHPGGDDERNSRLGGASDQRQVDDLA